VAEKDGENAIGRQYFVEDVFEDFEEYKQYLCKALALFREQDKRRNPTLQKYVPEYLEIHFNKTIKAPRLYFPRYQGIIVVELPDSRIPPKKKEFLRAKALERYAGVVKVNELAVGDEFAMRMKIMERKPRRGTRA
jgi:hypothetical protein